MLPHDMWSHTGAGNPEAFDNGHLVTLLQWMGIGFDKQLFVASRLDGQALGSGVVRPECAGAVGLTSTALVALTIQYSRMKVEFAESGVCDVWAWTCVDSRVDSGEGCDACQCVRGHAWGDRAGSRRTARYACMHVYGPTSRMVMLGRHGGRVPVPTRVPVCGAVRVRQQRCGCDTSCECEWPGCG